MANCLQHLEATKCKVHFENGKLKKCFSEDALSVIELQGLHILQSAAAVFVAGRCLGARFLTNVFASEVWILNHFASAIIVALGSLKSKYS